MDNKKQLPFTTADSEIGSVYTNGSLKYRTLGYSVRKKTLSWLLRVVRGREEKVAKRTENGSQLPVRTNIMLSGRSVDSASLEFDPQSTLQIIETSSAVSEISGMDGSSCHSKALESQQVVQKDATTASAERSTPSSDPAVLFGDDKDCPLPPKRRQLKVMRILEYAIIGLIGLLLMAITVAVTGWVVSKNNTTEVQQQSNGATAGGNVVIPTSAVPICEPDSLVSTFHVSDEVGEQTCAYLHDRPAARKRMCQQGNPGSLYCPTTCRQPGACIVSNVFDVDSPVSHNDPPPPEQTEDTPNNEIQDTGDGKKDEDEKDDEPASEQVQDFEEEINEAIDDQPPSEEMQDTPADGADEADQLQDSEVEQNEADEATVDETPSEQTQDNPLDSAQDGANDADQPQGSEIEQNETDEVQVDETPSEQMQGTFEETQDDANEPDQVQDSEVDQNEADEVKDDETPAEQTQGAPLEAAQDGNNATVEQIPQFSQPTVPLVGCVDSTEELYISHVYGMRTCSWLSTMPGPLRRQCKLPNNGSQFCPRLCGLCDPNELETTVSRQSPGSE